ncbi:MAG TPA: CDGSH iron-sulfur domain-containing protein [Woeseiaceae bacterium]|nr:CDGSH iron-sulfur domain-containing protein [Woeseiaceae bacterium]
MPTPTIARLKPYLVQVTEGRSYLWCACGRSRNQPFCDGSHKGTDFEPVRWRATNTEDKLFCACKHTATSPFCDGTHNRLSDTYAEADPSVGADAKMVDYERASGGALKAQLDDGCYVIRVAEEAMHPVQGISIYPVIGEADGARHISQYLALVPAGQSPILAYPGSDVVLFIQAGNGTVRIADRYFEVTPESGVCVKPGEGFQITNEDAEPVWLSISVCPPCAAPDFPRQMPTMFDESVPERVQGVDESKQEAMADRFFQVLIGDRTHGTPVTQFIGKIPCSRAAHHRHLYEETITVLDGEGFMWTDHAKTPVQPGDTIFLPLKQAHSLECTSKNGMRLVGLFFPSMSPAINY